MARAVARVGSAHAKSACEMCFVSFLADSSSKLVDFSFVEHEKGMRKVISNANGLAETIQR